MIQAVLTLVAPPGSARATIQALKALLLQAESEPGFVFGDLWQEAEDPDVLCYVEEWRTSQDLDRQICSDRYTQLLRLMETAAEPPAFQLKWITETRGLEYLAALRLPSQDSTDAVVTAIPG